MLLFAVSLSCSGESGPVSKTIPDLKSRSLAYQYISKLPSRNYWPTNEWVKADPEEAGMNVDGLRKMEEYAFHRDGDEQDGLGYRTDSVVIIRHGNIVYEKYARDYKPDQLHVTWSVTKSVTNALVGIAVKDGLFKINDPVSRYLPEFDTPDTKDITVKNFLEWNSGIEWDESYGTSPVYSSVLAMLYTPEGSDMASFVAHHKRIHKPGQFFYYSSGDTNVLNKLLKAVMPPDEYDSYPWKRLFEPLGIKKAVWEKDPSGVFVGSSYVYLSARDMAKFAYLYLNDGVWNGSRILPEGWVEYSTTLSESFFTTPWRPDVIQQDRPGAQMYTNIDDPSRNIPMPYPDAPKDMVAFTGHWGQRIFIIPSLDMVVVRFGDDRETDMDHNEFLKLIVKSVVSGETN